MFARISSVPLAMIAVLATAPLAPAMAASDAVFFKAVAGEWKGPGEIVAGKYKGTRFSCNLEGLPESGKRAGISLDGNCRVGVFSQKMSAVITRKGRSYSGRFLDGAAGEGLDVVSGRISSEQAVVAIKRKKLDGAMVAKLLDPETLNVSISVKVGETMVPVIGMTLKRSQGRVQTGSLR
ncbi:hypothetical protein [Pseudohoeflea coraliihabitans]|uniref:Uncharacterized protein n=1 Tax=Pseudohoeflea coraliihabitans TaxID=2860393 RepID=A0ABS6WQ69_9HYPH|nr:hypothetical protein [Pseudohoeflea sp. DP4N28-3]MBW3098065.1 hypothetical protein [Pseudohoeflea sp. DP4N28-3]